MSVFWMDQSVALVQRFSTFDLQKSCNFVDFVSERKWQLNDSKYFVPFEAVEWVIGQIGETFVDIEKKQFSNSKHNLY